MAAANLQLSSKLVSFFEQAQNDPIRWIQTKIDDVTFDLTTSGKSSGDLTKDLKDLQAKLDKEACIALVCVDENSSPKKWVVLAYVPQTSVVKKRMLYASGRQDIKTKLGQQYFKGEAHIAESSELTAQVVLREKTDHEDLPYTLAELSLKEDVALSARPGEKLEKGMANVQFGLSKDMEDAIEEFNAGKVDWVACKVEKDEKIYLVEKTKIGNIKQSVTSKIDPKEPRFYLARRLGTPVGDQTYLVFSCPETSAIKLRMVYSTCKATLLELASLGGVKYRLLEIRAPDELDDVFVREETIDENAGKIVHQDVAKPRGPGRKKG
jgi:twinfilin-like protein